MRKKNNFFNLFKSDILCDPKKATSEKPDVCPQESKCIDNGTHGACNCPKELVINEKFNVTDKNSRYCIKIDVIATTIVPATNPPVTNPPVTVLPVTNPPAASTTTTQKVMTERSVMPTNSEPTPDPEVVTKKITEQVISKTQAHHIFGGIVLPIMIVLSFFGIVFAVRKYDLIERSQNYIRNRRHPQTRYDGLENDFDDDPLLI
jgi:hypothetical protein